jgi:hypothetical protein
MNFKGYVSDHLPKDQIADRVSENQIIDHLSDNQIADHLSANQIDEHLIGDLAAAAAAHLAACDLCESRVAHAVAPIEAFKAVTVAWSERRSATLPLHQTLARSAKFHPRLAWAAAVATALAIGAAIPVVTHQQRQETARIGAAAHTPGADTTTNGGSGQIGRDNVASENVASDNIANDNQMLKAIDRELDVSAETPEVFGLRPVSGASEHKPERPSSVQD